MTLVQAVDTLDVLWQQYGSHKTETLRQALTLRYMHVVRFHAARIHRKLPGHLELDDLIQSGTLGLRDAIAAFDPARGVKFETYCAPRVRGAIFDSLHNLTWVPRAIRRQVQMLQQAREELRLELGREPAEEELAGRLQMAPAAYQKFLQQSTRLSFSSLSPAADHQDSPARLEGLRDQSVPDPADALQREDLRRLLTRTLSRAERLVLILYYAEQMTMREIAATLGVSESRVSQMHSELMAQLRERWQRRFLEASGRRGISIDL